MSRRFLLLPLFLAAYLALIIPFTDHMKRRPFVEKLGYVPKAELLKAAAADQKATVAAGLMMRALFYYGSLIEVNFKEVIVPPDFFALYKTIETAVKLDPYNMDAYYFGQAVMAWEIGRIAEANALLEYGMKYRTWDYTLPFYAGFNYAYFLKDYQKAAIHYKRAAELSGVSLYANLAGRYLYESGQTDMAIAYLSTMVKGAKNDAIKQEFSVRLAAITEVRRIQVARDRYRNDTGRYPYSLEQLQAEGYLAPPPVDPYGGRFYLDEKHEVKTTSELAFFKGRKNVPHRSGSYELERPTPSATIGK